MKPARAHGGGDRRRGERCCVQLGCEKIGCHRWVVLRAVGVCEMMGLAGRPVPASSPARFQLYAGAGCARRTRHRCGLSDSQSCHRAGCSGGCRRPCAASCCAQLAQPLPRLQPMGPLCHTCKLSPRRANTTRACTTCTLARAPAALSSHRPHLQPATGRRLPWVAELSGSWAQADSGCRPAASCHPGAHRLLHPRLCHALRRG